MRIFNLILANLLVGMALNCAGAQAPASRPWSAATYHGLTVGTSTRADVLKVLGKPNFVGREEDTGVPTITFPVPDPMPGTLTVYMKKGILDGMRLDLNESLSKSDIIRIFGHNYVVVHYATDDALTPGEPHRSIKILVARSSTWNTVIRALLRLSHSMMTRRSTQSYSLIRRSVQTTLNAEDAAMLLRSGPTAKPRG